MRNDFVDVDRVYGFDGKIIEKVIQHWDNRFLILFTDGTIIKLVGACYYDGDLGIEFSNEIEKFDKDLLGITSK